MFAIRQERAAQTAGLRLRRRMERVRLGTTSWHSARAAPGAAGSETECVTFVVGKRGTNVYGRERVRGGKGKVGDLSSASPAPPSRERRPGSALALPGSLRSRANACRRE